MALKKLITDVIFKEHTDNHAPVDAEKNVIVSVKRNGSKLTPNSNREVDVTSYDTLRCTTYQTGDSGHIQYQLASSNGSKVGPVISALNEPLIEGLQIFDALKGGNVYTKIPLFSQQWSYLDLHNQGSNDAYQALRFGYFSENAYERLLQIDAFNLFLNVSNTGKLYSTKSLSTVSDARKKNSSEVLSSENDKYQKYIAMWNNMKPRVFRINGEDDTYHIGYFAQEVEEALYDSGLTESDFSGIVKIKDFIDNGTNSSDIQSIDECEYFEELYTLSYPDCLMLSELKLRQVVNEIIPQLTKQINDMQSEIDSLRNEIKILKGE